MMFGLLMCNTDVYIINLTVVSIRSFLGLSKYVAIYKLFQQMTNDPLCAKIKIKTFRKDI